MSASCRRIKIKSFCINMKILVKILSFIFLFSFLTLFFANIYVSRELTYSLMVAFMMNIVIFIILSPLFLLIPVGMFIETIIYKRKLNIKNTRFTLKMLLNFCRCYLKGDISKINRFIEKNLIDKKIDFTVIKDKFIMGEFTAYIGESFFIVVSKITTTYVIIKIYSSDTNTLKELNEIMEVLKKSETI